MGAELLEEPVERERELEEDDERDEELDEPDEERRPCPPPARA